MNEFMMLAGHTGTGSPGPHTFGLPRMQLPPYRAAGLHLGKKSPLVGRRLSVVFETSKLSLILETGLGKHLVGHYSYSCILMSRDSARKKYASSEEEIEETEPFMLSCPVVQEQEHKWVLVRVITLR